MRSGDTLDTAAYRAFLAKQDRGDAELPLTILNALEAALSMPQDKPLDARLFGERWDPDAMPGQSFPPFAEGWNACRNAVREAAGVIEESA